MDDIPEGDDNVNSKLVPHFHTKENTNFPCNYRYATM